MKILITGASGFLGARIVEKFRQASYEVVPSSRGGSSDKNEHYACDVSDPAQLLGMMDRVSPDVIVNCAAKIDFGQGVLEDLYAVNVLAPAIMAEWGASNSAYVCHISSVAVFGVGACQIDEGSPVAPDTDYGRSKWLSEMCLDASGVSGVSLRMGGIFGRDGPSHLGVNNAIRGCMKGQVPKVFGSGKAKRNYIHVSDACDVVLYCIEEKVTGKRLVGGEIVSVKQMMTSICDVFSLGAEPVYVAGDDGHDQIICSSEDLPSSRSFAEALEGDL